MLKIMLLFIALLFSNSAPAAFLDGNKLYKDLLEAEKPSNYNAFSAGEAYGYVFGIVDSFNYNEYHPALRVCLPEGVTGRQLIDVVLRYLREAPEFRHMSAHTLVLYSLDKAFPCK